MNIVIYANASSDIGTGHVMRCLTLADFFRNQGCNILFMSDISLTGNLLSLIISKNYEIVKPGIEYIPDNTDWLVIDNYNVDKEFESQARQQAKYIMVIDDLANRFHDCDILLDQNLYHNMSERYQNLVPKHCKLLLGPKYALLRDEFIAERQRLPKNNDKIHKILVNFGGIDHVDMTSCILKILKNYDIEIEIIMGKNSLHLDKVKQICAQEKKFNLHVQASNIANLIANCDLAIAAGGTSVWERFCLGIPAIIVAIAENQIKSSITLAEKNLCFYAGFHNDNKINNKISKILDSCILDHNILKKQSAKIKLLLDGTGKEYVWSAISNREI